MAVDTKIPYGRPGVAEFESQTLGGPREPRFGEGVPTTTHHEVTITGEVDWPIHAVVAMANGAMALATVGAAAGFASGTITVSSTGPTNGQEIYIGGVTYTFVTALSDTPTVPFEIEISATPAVMAQRIADAINGVVGDHVSEGTTANPLASATVEGAEVTVTANVAGTEGNAIQFEDGPATNVAFDPTSDVLAGGSDDTSLRPFGILAAPVRTTGTATMVLPVYREGHWDMDALVWDASFATDEMKRRAFEGGRSPNIFISKGKFNDDAIY